MSTTIHLSSIGDVARTLGQPLHVVSYLVMSRNIQPAQRAGRLRLFDDEAIGRIRDELHGRELQGSKNHA